MVNEEYRSTPKSSVKWLNTLFFANLASIFLSLIALLPVGSGWTSWIGKLISLVVIVACFGLAPEGVRYRRAAVCRLGILTIALFHTLFSVRTVLVLASSVLSFVALYQEYKGHAELIREADRKLAGKWGRFFVLQIVCTLVISLVTAVVTVAVTMLLEPEAAVAAEIVAYVAEGEVLVMNVIYLNYLRRTIRLMRE